MDDGSGQFHVTGGFTYAEEGSYTVQVTLTHDLLPSVLATSSTATVADAQLINATGVNVSATEGALFSGSVATFTDPAGSEPIADYTATIDWGGAGTGSTTGTIVDDGSGQFHVTGGFTYAEEGSYTVQVTLTHDLLPSVLATSSTATVADAALTFQAGTNFGVVQGTDSGPQIVANFTDLGGSEPVGDYVATIHWGLGPDSLGIVASTGPGTFSVTGNHTYTAPGSYNISVSIDHEGTPFNSGTTSVATVAQTFRVTNFQPNPERF